MYRQVNERIEDLNDMFGEMSGEFFVVASVATPYVWSRSLCRGRHTSGRGRIQLSSSSGPGTRQLPWRTLSPTEAEYVVVEKYAGKPARLAQETDQRG